MSASVVTRSTWTDDAGDNISGTIVGNAQLQAIYDNIDVLFSGTGAYATLECGGGVKVDGVLNVAGGLLVTQQTKSSNYTIVDTDHTIFASGTITITLPTAVGRAGRQFVVKNISANTVTVGSNGGNIDGSSTFSLTVQYMSITVESDGTNWFIV